MKKFIKSVSKCSECPNCKIISECCRDKDGYCTELKRVVFSFDGDRFWDNIPNDCPLQTIDIEETFPKYVSLNNTTLKLQGDVYFRDAGHWSVGYKIINGELVSWCDDKELPHLHLISLKEISKEEYLETNKGYI